jgi:hypothetical protein
MAFDKNAATNNNFANDDDTIGTDDWNPTEKTFNHFLKRDFVLCSKNVQQLLLSTRDSQSLRELKECLLHSHDVIERVLASKIASGLVKEEKGRYSLVR